MNEIQKYFRYRQSLIDQYVKGDMTKNEYLDENLRAVFSLKIKPFRNIDNVEKGLFNYQYYNALAKESKKKSALYPDKQTQQEYADKSNYYYEKKDKATSAIMKILDYKNMEAYFIKVRSKYLRGKLFEILLTDYEMILHSTNTVILNTLRAENVFCDDVRKSLIDGYINAKY